MRLPPPRSLSGSVAGSALGCRQASARRSRGAGPGLCAPTLGALAGGARAGAGEETWRRWVRSCAAAAPSRPAPGAPDRPGVGRRVRARAARPRSSAPPRPGLGGDVVMRRLRPLRCPSAPCCPDVPETRAAVRSCDRAGLRPPGHPQSHLQVTGPVSFPAVGRAVGFRTLACTPGALWAPLGAGRHPQEPCWENMGVLRAPWALARTPGNRSMRKWGVLRTPVGTCTLRGLSMQSWEAQSCSQGTDLYLEALNGIYWDF